VGHHAPESGLSPGCSNSGVVGLLLSLPTRRRTCTAYGSCGQPSSVPDGGRATGLSGRPRYGEISSCPRGGKRGGSPSLPVVPATDGEGFVGGRVSPRWCQAAQVEVDARSRGEKIGEYTSGGMVWFDGFRCAACRVSVLAFGRQDEYRFRRGQRRTGQIPPRVARTSPPAARALDDAHPARGGSRTDPATVVRFRTGNLPCSVVRRGNGSCQPTSQGREGCGRRPGRGLAPGHPVQMERDVRRRQRRRRYRQTPQQAHGGNPPGKEAGSQHRNEPSGRYAEFFPVQRASPPKPARSPGISV
jgi:hypothetical protein